MSYDFIVIGSGFGGSVAALRLVEKGYRVLVLEQGRHITSEDMHAAEKNPLKLFWAPELGLKGYFSQHIFQHIGAIGGIGVGGGSIVYAAVLLEPDRRFFTDPAWSGLGVDWYRELEPHYTAAKRMLGRTQHQCQSDMDSYLKKTAETMGAADTFAQIPLGIYFGQPGLTKPDPFFQGKGPPRTGCRLCGSCLTGCPYHSKNSLDKNYLYLAEQLGAEIMPERQVKQIRPIATGYQVEMINPLNRRQQLLPLQARQIIVSAGVVGTLKLLFHCRDVAKTLPAISSQLGENVLTNSEAIVGVLANGHQVNLSEGGPTITSHFYPNEHTHITQNRFPKGYTFMKAYMGPLVNDQQPLRRALKTLAAFITHPFRSTRSWRSRLWHQRVSILTVMQRLDSRLSFQYGRGPFSLFRRGLQSKTAAGRRPPTNLPEANRAAQVFAGHANGQPLNNLPESLGNLSVTAHILGGCHMGESAATGVIDSNHALFSYPGIYIVDGSAVSANIGVNPSLTITALAERCMSKIPPAPGRNLS